MTIASGGETNPERPLRLWPGVAIVALQWLARFVLPLFVPGTAIYGVLGGALGGLGILVWWMFFSRAPWSERLGAVILMVLALAATPYILHDSMATAGMGILFYLYAIPPLCLAFVLWAVATRELPDRTRRLTMVVTILVACGAWGLVRTSGVNNQGSAEFAWRWAPTPEERLLAQAGGLPPKTPPPPLIPEAEAEWPGFRGSARNGIVAGVRIDPDWSASPPVELWRQPVGPGWSSFAVLGQRIFTQEQRGDDEVVSSYRLATGEPVWLHRDATRFWEANAGAGPRGTPTVHAGRVYTFGAGGLLNALDATDGSVVWSRDVASDTGVEVPYWGFSSSPLVMDDVVVVAAAGTLAAYDVADGGSRWSGPDGGGGYSSPHGVTLEGVPQVLLASVAGAVSVSPSDGTPLWEHPWDGGVRIVQPARVGEDGLLISRGGTTGIRRIAVAQGPEGWTVEERWTSRGLKPYFSDFVVHDGHAYGFDGNILSCIELESGDRRWKGGRYGGGQLVLLDDQGLLLVISEQGELALVEAVPGQFTELARFPALEGKTWNHPVVVGDTLLVRNDREMVAFRLSLVTTALPGT